MVSGIYQMIDGCLIHKIRFETIANNLANINTSAFKKDFISFSEQLASQYVSSTDFKAGDIMYTGNQMDLALAGKGFFKIQTARGIRYTRNGALTRNTEGMLATAQGDAVMGQNGPIKIEGQKVDILHNGQILVDGKRVDRLEVVDFDDLQQLRKEGASMFRYQGEDDGIQSVETLDIRQGYLEGSNVNSTEEMIKMIETMRAFESSQRAIHTIDDITSKMVNDYGLIQ